MKKSTLEYFAPQREDERRWEGEEEKENNIRVERGKVKRRRVNGQQTYLLCVCVCVSSALWWFGERVAKLKFWPSVSHKAMRPFAEKDKHVCELPR
jgi:hypothetical protein